MIHIRFYKLLSVFSGALMVSGCATVSLPVSLNIPLSFNLPDNFSYTEDNTLDLAPASFPTYHAGDRYFYTRRGVDTITAVNELDFEIVRRNNRRTVFNRNIFQPETFMETSRSLISRTVSLQSGRLWPLEVGNSVTYRSDLVVVSKETGAERELSRRWRCEVHSKARVSALAGEFDTYRIDCTRLRSRGRPSLERTWFYAPEIGTYVMRRDFSFSRNRERFRMLTAIRPDLSGLAREDRRGVVRTWQSALETHLSDDPMVWQSETSGVQTRVTPLSTFQGESGQFCRTYRQDVTFASGPRTYVGLACRNREGRWRTPRM